jgi:hypothetical protein
MGSLSLNLQQENSPRNGLQAWGEYRMVGGWYCVGARRLTKLARLDIKMMTMMRRRVLPTQKQPSSDASVAPSTQGRPRHDLLHTIDSASLIC